VDAQKILSCVARTGGRFGSRLVIDVLQGNKNEKIERLGFDKLSTFGISDKKTRKLRAIIDFLVMQKYLARTHDEYAVIKLGDRADEVLRGGAAVEMKLPKDAETPKTKIAEEAKSRKSADKPYAKPAGKSAKKSAGKPAGESLFDVLRKLRLEIATEQNVPAFVVFSDSTLADMCVRLPQTKRGFIRVSGVGSVKLEKYGDRFLEAIAEYRRNSIAGNAADNAGAETVPDDEVPF
jgi:ATP-dependent DNA helicase RecQ